MENRYADILRDYNQKILELIPANSTLRIVTALELKKALRTKRDKILEIGVGEANSTTYLLELNPGIKIDVLDASKEMIAVAKKRLPHGRVNFIVEDGLDYLNNYPGLYDCIVSEWTIHNFKWEEKMTLLKAIFAKLAYGGKLILMEKIYPDDEKLGRYLFDLQNKRFSNYLPKEAGDAIVEHEIQDFSEEYRMSTSQTIKVLKDIGFSRVKITDRVEREVVLVAEK